MPSDCLDDAEIVAFLAGDDDESVQARIDEHVDTCADCRAVLIALARVDGATADERAEPQPADAPHPAAELAPGEQLGRYVIMNELGRGGMGAVYAAFDPELDRDVAVKVLHRRRRDGSAGEQARLLQEARALARLGHPNIVGVYDVGTTETGEVFIAMELVDGLTLREWLAAEPRSWRQITETFLEAGRGLIAAHAADMVHRDFKPENVLIGSDNRVRIGDFGLVRVAASVGLDGDTGGGADSGAVTMTRTGVALGTPAYMAPEQLARDDIDHRCDQFSFCVALYEALCGERPFGGENIAALHRAMTETPATWPADNKAPTWLGQVVLRGLQRDPERRFDSMAELVAALEVGLAPPRRRRLVPLAIAVAAAVGIGLGLVVLSRQQGVADSCGVPDYLDRAWNAETRSQLKQVFTNAEHVAPVANWQIVERRFDEHVGGLRNLYVEHCAARDDPVAAQRRDCLDHRSAEVAGFVSVFTDGQRIDHKVARATHALEYLSPLADCRRPSYLQELRPDRDNPPIAVLRLEVGAVAALTRLWLMDDARLRGELAWQQAEALGAHQLSARAWLAMANAQAFADRGEVPDKLGVAATAAETHGLPLLAAKLRLLEARYAQDSGRRLDRAVERIRAAGDDRGMRTELLHVRAKLARARARDASASKALTRQILAAYEHNPRPNYVRLARFLRHLGDAAKRDGDRNRAAQHYTRALGVAVRYLGDFHRYTVQLLDRLANMMRLAGNHKRAMKYYARLVPLLQRHFGRDHPTTVQAAVHWVSELSIMQVEPARVDRVLDELEGVASPAASPSHQLLGKVLQARALVLSHRGQSDRAIEYHRRAVELARKRHGDNDLRFLGPVVRLAKAHASAGNHREAVRLLSAHLPAVEAALIGRGGVGSVMMTYGYSLEQLGRTAEATAILERALTVDPPGTTSRVDAAIIRLRLARLLAKRPGHRRRALGLARQARDYARGVPARWRSLQQAIAALINRLESAPSASAGK